MNVDVQSSELLTACIGPVSYPAKCPYSMWTSIGMNLPVNLRYTSVPAPCIDLMHLTAGPVIALLSYRLLEFTRPSLLRLMASTSLRVAYYRWTLIGRRIIRRTQTHLAYIREAPEYP